MNILTIIQTLQFLCIEPLPDNADLTTAGSYSFKYKSGLLGNANAEGGNAIWKNTKILVPVKYVCNFFRSLELPLINTKLYMQLNWAKNSVISNFFVLLCSCGYFID